MELIIVLLAFVLVFAFKLWSLRLGEGYYVFEKKLSNIASLIISLIVFILLVLGLASQGLAPIFKGTLFILSIICYLLLFFIGLYPASFAFRLSRVIVNFDFREKISGFWRLFDQNQFRRNFMIMLLLFFCLIVAVLNLTAFSLFYEKTIHGSDSKKGSYLILFFVFLVIVFFLDYVIHKKLPETAEHKKAEELKNIIENLCLTAGAVLPEIRIVNLNIATAFVNIDNFSKRSSLNVSIGLLNLLERNELEAVMAHELSHIISGQAVDYRNISLLLSLLRSFGGGLLVLWFSTIYPVLFYFWIIMLLLLSLDRYKTNNIYRINSDSIIFTLFIFFMPSFSIINFIGCLTFYFLSYYEDLSADLHAILLTRNPEGLFRALEKIGAEKLIIDERVNTEMNFLYFTGENIYKDTPQIQPSIGARIEMIETIDGALKELVEVKVEKTLDCPACKGAMAKIKADSHYIRQNIELDKCPECGGIWFDESELQYVANLLLLQTPKLKLAKFIPDASRGYACPLCGVNLERDKSVNLPSSVNIYNCPSCEGSFLTEEGVENLEKFKETSKENENKKNTD